jgi:PleD family two-component response regulator
MTDDSGTTKILVVDDDPATRDIIRLSLCPLGYHVSEATTGTEALEKVIIENPDIIVLDVMLPEKSGLEVCQYLKESSITAHLPIIMLTAKQDLADKLAGLDTGADDYVIKPFDPLELEARIKALLRKTRRDLHANPLTHLPGSISIEKEIQRVIDEAGPFAAIFVDLDNFKAYNDNYGYAAGNRIITFTAHTIMAAVKRYGSPQDFIGHIGGDDFVCLTTPEYVDKICQEIIRIFDQLIHLHYREDDLNKGYIVNEDRRGVIKKFPLMTITLVVITNEESAFDHHLQVSEKAAELKRHVKMLHGSNYRKDRRRGSTAPKVHKGGSDKRDET